MDQKNVMALIATTRNMRGHLNDTATLSRRANALAACRAYYKSLRIMLAALPERDVSEARHKVYPYPSHTLVKELSFMEVTCATAERLLGMTPR